MDYSMIKYSDERNKKYSIKTTIDGNSCVIKTAIFPEGIMHLQRAFNAQFLLDKFYSNVKYSKAKMLDDRLEFEFIKGVSLEGKYRDAFEKQDITEINKLLENHYDLIIGTQENQCIYESNDNFRMLFGGDDEYVGKQALKFTNFDAIPSNVIYQDNTPYFIDYEWTMDFCFPLDLVVYNCFNSIFLKYPNYEKICSLEKILKKFKVTTSICKLQENYEHFFAYIITDDKGNSYAKDKVTCLKPQDTIGGIRQEWENCAEQWKKSIQANEEKDKEISEIRQEWENCAEQWKKSIQANEEKDKEISEIRQEWENCAEMWKKSIQVNEEKDKEISEIRQEWENCAEQWKRSVQANEEKDKEISEIRVEWEKCAEMWKSTSEVLKNKNDAYDKLEQENKEQLAFISKLLNANVFEFIKIKRKKNK